MAPTAVIVQGKPAKELDAEQRRHLEQVRRSARESAREVQELARGELDRAHAGPGVMRAPPASDEPAF